jgi:hypothetical protein
MTRESQVAVADLLRLTGKRYPKLEAALHALDAEAATELLRLTQDIGHEVRQAERKAAIQPWRHGR